MSWFRKDEKLISFKDAAGIIDRTMKDILDENEELKQHMQQFRNRNAALLDELYLARRAKDDAALSILAKMSSVALEQVSEVLKKERDAEWMAFMEKQNAKKQAKDN